jgi:putative nucleotidyltransferase with HDIG domain
MSELVARSVTLLRAFVLLSALILASGAMVLGSILTDALRSQAVDDAKVSLAQFTNAVVGPRLVEGDSFVATDQAAAALSAAPADRPDILSVKVWQADGTLAWTSLAPERIGKRFPLSAHLREVIESGEAEGELENLADEEDAAEAGLGVSSVLEVYAPVRANGRVIGAYEIYADSRPLEASIAERKHLMWVATALVFAALWAVLVLLVRGASSTLTRQTTILRERSRALSASYRRLEESALEAIESLNATVEAKDPYTAGHSLRVQRIALAIGEELGFAPRDLDALRFGGLFHDIGKIAVPDSILTKPERLTPEEYNAIKEHSAEGARIVAKFSRLRDTVPVIRHHHERWDGRGYPDGLAAETIPLPAAIVGLADAWDAMTTERPYSRALDLDEAFAEIRAGRGTQFAPEVVDAFFRAVRTRPGEFGAAESDGASVAAG